VKNLTCLPRGLKKLVNYLLNPDLTGINLSGGFPPWGSLLRQGNGVKAAKTRSILSQDITRGPGLIEEQQSGGPIIDKMQGQEAVFHHFGGAEGSG